MLTYEEQTSVDFISRICAEVRKGYSVTPFVGAGISSRSGIIMGLEFAEYLTFTVYRCVVPPQDQRQCLKQSSIELWNVRHYGWPESPRPFEVEAVREWVADNYEKLCEACGVRVNFDHKDDSRTVRSLSPDLVREGGPATLDNQIRRPLLPAVLRGERTAINDTAVKDFLRAVGAEGAARGEVLRTGVSTDSREGLIERAVRSLHDWRATLHFLAELDLISVGTETRPCLDEHDSGVIDSFNSHITRGRKPNLAHSMLAHLADPLRTRVVLTTNFDSLLEDAFAQLGEPLTVIPVGSHSQLPSRDTVHAQNTLIKLHGSLTDTRADYSLDEPPSISEKSRFFHYVIGESPPKSTTSPLMRGPILLAPGFLSSHLLVVGYGGGDDRILQNIKFVLDHSPDSLLFWICFNNSDLLHVQKLFAESDYRNRQRVVVTVTDRSDLLLLDLYQEMTHGMPRGGFSYEFSHDVPPKLWKYARDKSQGALGPGEGGSGGQEIASRARAIAKVISNRVAQRKGSGRHSTNIRNRIWHEDNKILYVDTESGLMAVLREAFAILKSERFSCVWIEMEDYATPESLAHGLLQIIALRRGLFQLEHAVLMPHRFSEFLEHDSDPEQRKEFGVPKTGSKAWRERLFRMSRYFRIQNEKWIIFLYGRNVPGICAGWDRAPWTRQQYVDFHKLLDGLAANGFIVVYAPYSIRRMNDDAQKAAATRARENELRKNVSCIADTVDTAFPSEWWDPDKVESAWVDSILEDAVKPGGASSERYQRVEVSPIPSTSHYIEELLPYFGNEVISVLYPKTASPDQDYVLRAHFLFACSLFRRSRPIPAFLSEGVFPPFEAFNSDGLDNDWARHAQAETWVTTFRQRGFVWRKPGGNIWLYRDARLGMQAMLQKCLDVPVWPKKGGAAINAAYTIRARTHFWIAAWYARAFFTTSHSVPLIEAFHHIFMSVKFGSVAERPKKKGSSSPGTGEQQTKYRQQLWIRSVSSIIKLMKVGRSSLLFWLDQPSAESLFGPAQMERVYSEIANRAPLGPSSTTLGKHRDNLLRLLRAEWESIWASFSRRPHQSVFGNHGEDSSTSQISYCKARIFSEEAGEWRKRLRDSKGRVIKPSPKIDTWILILVDHERRSMRFFSQRPGAVSSRIHHFALTSQIRKIDNDLYRRLRDCGDATGRKLLGTDSLLRLIESLRDLTYDHVRRAKVLEHTSKGKQLWCDVLPCCRESRPIWMQVTALSRSIFNLCRSVPPHLVDFEYGQRVYVSSLYALALGRLGRFIEAHRRLSEANARLSKVPRHVDQVELAVIELRRGEVHLMEAILISRLLEALVQALIRGREYKVETPVFALLDLLTRPERHDIVSPAAMTPSEQVAHQWYSVYEMAHLRMEIPSSCDIHEISLTQKQDLAKALIEHLSRIHFARLDDSWVALEQAERLLAGRTRSSQWWGRLCTLRLRVFASHLNEVDILNFGNFAVRTGKSSPVIAKQTPEIDRWKVFLGATGPYRCTTMAFRRKIDYQDYLVSILRLGLVVWPDDPYRRLRLSDYFLRSWGKHFSKKGLSDEAKSLVKESLDPCSYNLEKDHPLLFIYHGKVAASIDKILKRYSDDH